MAFFHSKEISEMPCASGMTCRFRIYLFTVGGNPLSADYAMCCQRVLSPHCNTMRPGTYTSHLLRGVCPNTCIEPGLQPLSGEAFQLHTANMDKEAWVWIRVKCLCTSAQVTFLTLGVVLHEKTCKVGSCLCLIYSQCIITFIVHTSVAIVVVNMQCIQVVPVLPANEVNSV